MNSLLFARHFLGNGPHKLRKAPMCANSIIITQISLYVRIMNKKRGRDSQKDCACSEGNIDAQEIYILHNSDREIQWLRRVPLRGRHSYQCRRGIQAHPDLIDLNNHTQGQSRFYNTAWYFLSSSNAEILTLRFRSYWLNMYKFSRIKMCVLQKVSHTSSYEPQLRITAKLSPLSHTRRMAHS